MLTLALFSLSGVALAALGWFILPAIAGVAVFSGCVALAVDLRSVPHRIPWLALAALILSLLVFVVLVWPPAEVVLGGWDAGAYFTTGAQLARTGSFSSMDPFLAAVGPDARRAFTIHTGSLQPYLLPGFYLTDSGTIVPQFGMLLSVWIGVGVLLGGPAGGLAVAPVVGMLAVALLFLLVRRAWNTAVGLAAALLLATNGGQVWHAQHTLAEEMVQVFLLGGLWLGLLALRQPHPLYAATAGLLLALLPLVKTEAVVLASLGLGAIGLALIMPHKRVAFPHPQSPRSSALCLWILGKTVLRQERIPPLERGVALYPPAPSSPVWAEGEAARGQVCPLPGLGGGRRSAATAGAGRGEGTALLLYGWPPGLAAFIAGTMLGALASLIHYLTTARIYAFDQVLQAPGYLLLGGGILALGVLATAAVGHRSRFAGWQSQHTRSTALALSLAGLLVWSGLAGFGLVPLTPGSFAQALYLGAYLTPADVGVLVVGGMILMLRPPVSLHREQTMILFTFALASVFYLAIYAYYVAAQDRIPLYMWATRRLAPVVLPLLALGQALTLAWVFQRLPRGRGLMLLAVVGCLVLLRVPTLQNFWGHRDYQGALAQLAALDARLPVGAVLLFDADVGTALGTPLRFLHGRETHVLWSGTSEQVREGVAALRAWAAAAGQEVWYLSSQPNPHAGLILAGGAEAVGRERLEFSALERRSDARPTHINLFTADLMLFRLLDASLGTALPLRVDVGAEDAVAYALLRDGWHQQETDATGTTYRWTGPTATFALPPGLTGAAHLRLRVGAGDRPERNVPPGTEPPPGWTVVRCGSHELGAIEPRPWFTDYTLFVPASCAAAGGIITLQVVPWTPATDGRVVGLRVESMSFDVAQGEETGAP